MKSSFDFLIWMDMAIIMVKGMSQGEGHRRKKSLTFVGYKKKYSMLIIPRYN